GPNPDNQVAGEICAGHSDLIVPSENREGGARQCRRGGGSGQVSANPRGQTVVATECQAQHPGCAGLTPTHPCHSTPLPPPDPPPPHADTAPRTPRPPPPDWRMHLGLQ